MSALFFCALCAYILDGKLSDFDGGDVHITWSVALRILVAGDICGAFLSPQDAGLITHTFVGSVLYIWFFLMFVIVCGPLSCCAFFFASGGESATYGNPSWPTIIISHALFIVVMWCFLIYYIVVNSSMIDFYNGEHYTDAWIETWTEREYNAYLDLIDGNWEKQFTFYFMLLSIGA